MSADEAALSWKSRAALIAGRFALQALGFTWRVKTIHSDVLTALRSSGAPFIFTLWHGQLLPLLWYHRGEGVTVLISEHRDGEIVAQAAASLGYRLIRGSTTRGSERALISLVRALKEGKEIAITPDGPRGPALRFAPGALIAAQRCGAQVLPVALVASRAWHLRSWDRFMIPKPFAKLTIAYGTPTGVLADTSRGAAAETARFEELMRNTQALAGG